MSTLNFVQFSWRYIPDFFWNRNDLKFSYIFKLPKEDWCEEVYNVLGKFKYKDRNFVKAQWSLKVKEHKSIISGLGIEYAKTCNDF